MQSAKECSRQSWRKRAWVRLTRLRSDSNATVCSHSFHPLNQPARTPTWSRNIMIWWAGSRYQDLGSLRGRERRPRPSDDALQLNRESPRRRIQKHTCFHLYLRFDRKQPFEMLFASGYQCIASLFLGFGVRLGRRESLFEAFEMVFVGALQPSGHLGLTKRSSAFLQHTVTVQLYSWWHCPQRTSPFCESKE